MATRDWHPPDHGSFAEQGGTWPPHCVQGTPGAELHPALDRARVDVPSSTRARTRAPRATRASRAPTSSGCCASAAIDRRHGRRPRHRLLREEHRARRAARGLRGGRRRAAPCAASTSSPGDSERALDELRAAGADGDLGMSDWDRMLRACARSSSACRRRATAATTSSSTGCRQRLPGGAGALAAELVIYETRRARAALPELARRYDEAGVIAWTVWVAVPRHVSC